MNQSIKVPQHFGKQLRNARKEQGLSQSLVAKSIEKWQCQISEVEQGSDVLLSNLLDYARYLGMELVLVPRTRLRDVEVVAGIKKLVIDLRSRSEPSGPRSMYAEGGPIP